MLAIAYKKTKTELSELTAYLAAKLTRKGSSRAETSMDGGVMEKVSATDQSKLRLESNHKEADTKLVLHAPDASSAGDTTLRVHSPDTDVLVLLLRPYPALCQDAAFVTGVGENHHAVKLGLL